jgi:hypothetical protein
MSRQKISLNTLSGSDSRDLSARYPADRIRVSAWYCQNLSEVPACYLGITRGRVRPFYLPVLPLYGFTKLYTNPFLIIYYLPNFKLPVLVLVWGLKRKKLNSGSHTLNNLGLVLLLGDSLLGKAGLRRSLGQPCDVPLRLLTVSCTGLT